MSNKSDLNPHIHVWMENPKETLGRLYPGLGNIEMMCLLRAGQGGDSSDSTTRLAR